MPYRPIRLIVAATLAVTVPLAGCTPRSGPQTGPSTAPAARAEPAMHLAAFDSCGRLLTDLRKAAADVVGPYGLPGIGGPETVMYAANGTRLAFDAARGSGPGTFSGTNTHEADADEPDIVKTDGRRIVTVTRGALVVVDAATRRETGRLNLGVPGAGDVRLLLAGDAALVLADGWTQYAVPRRGPISRSDTAMAQVLLVDLTGKPALVSRYRADGAIVDARQTGSTARVVLRSSPRIVFEDLPKLTDDDDRIAANRKKIRAAPADAWLPGYAVTTDGRTTEGHVPCDRVRRPTSYSGTSMVTVLTFDLTAPELGTGDPLCVVADGDTVYGTGTSLYLAADQRWRTMMWRADPNALARQHTDIYRFEFDGRSSPRYAAAGTVPGWLVNQYALSEWGGHLRIATTVDGPGGSAGNSSAVRVLQQRGGELVQTGVVDGLGKGERIYSVRFLGDRGYVVTFKQTDPLYSVDLSDPAKPAVTGELKINGYSAHLQPVGDGRLVGFGQDADANGRTRGTQVSLFDVADPATARRVAQHQVADGSSEAEYDPHALLWWPATKLLVVPVNQYDINYDGTGPAATSTALALRVTDTGLTRVGVISQPTTAGATPTIRRSLVVGDVLWTLSDVGLQASDLSTLRMLQWLPVT